MSKCIWCFKELSILGMKMHKAFCFEYLYAKAKDALKYAYENQQFSREAYKVEKKALREHFSKLFKPEVYEKFQQQHKNKPLIDITVEEFKEQQSEFCDDVSQNPCYNYEEDSFIKYKPRIIDPESEILQYQHEASDIKFYSTPNSINQAIPLEQKIQELKEDSKNLQQDKNQEENEARETSENIIMRTQNLPSDIDEMINTNEQDNEILKLFGEKKIINDETESERENENIDLNRKTQTSTKQKSSCIFKNKIQCSYFYDNQSCNNEELIESLAKIDPKKQEQSNHQNNESINDQILQELNQEAIQKENLLRPHLSTHTEKSQNIEQNKQLINIENIKIKENNNISEQFNQQSNQNIENINDLMQENKSSNYQESQIIQSQIIIPNNLEQDISDRNNIDQFTTANNDAIMDSMHKQRLIETKEKGKKQVKIEYNSSMKSNQKMIRNSQEKIYKDQLIKTTLFTEKELTQLILKNANLKAQSTMMKYNKSQKWSFQIHKKFRKLQKKNKSKLKLLNQKP